MYPSISGPRDPKESYPCPGHAPGETWPEGDEGYSPPEGDPYPAWPEGD